MHFKRPIKTCTSPELLSKIYVSFIQTGSDTHLASPRPSSGAHWARVAFVSLNMERKNDASTYSILRC